MDRLVTVDITWFKPKFQHCRETAKLELERRFGKRARCQREVQNLENDEDRNDEFNDENDSGYETLLCIFSSERNSYYKYRIRDLYYLFSYQDMNVENLEYFVQRRNPEIPNPANQNPPNYPRLLENLQKFIRIKDKIMRRRELNY